METERVIQGLLKHARPEILKEFRADSCIVSTAIGIDILTHFGILCEPLAIRVMAFNRAFADKIEAGEPWPKDTELNEWCNINGAYSVGLGFGEQQPNKWAGHLAVLVEKKYLLDLSIDQASRPIYDMVFEPYAAIVNDKFLNGTLPKIFAYKDCVMRIDILAKKFRQGYTASPDWIFPNRRKKIVEKTIALIKGSL